MRRSLALLAVVSLSTTVVAAVPHASAGGSCWDYKRVEKRAFRLINKARSARDIDTLRLDPELSRVARKHTHEMIEAKTLYHTPALKLASRVTNWLTLGENIGKGETAKQIHKAFMSSDAHRNNVLYSLYNFVGVGTVRKNGKLWTTVVFEARTNPGTTLTMPSC